MEIMHEQEDIPAEQNSQKTHSRVPGSLQNQKRTGHTAPPSGQGSQTPGRLGFAPAHRVRTRNEFAACFEAGRRYHGIYFLVFVLPRPETDASWRLGMAIGKKVGNAVVRNRVKRVLRESLRLCAPKAVSALDMVIVAKKKLDPGVLTLGLACRDLCPLLERMAKDFGRPPRPGDQTSCAVPSSGPYDSIGSPSHP
jgi:ribonuclease P protein component